MVCPGLSGLVGNLSSLCCVEGLGDSIEVKPFVPNVLEQMGGEYGLGNASCGDKPTILAVAESAGRVIGRPGAMGKRQKLEGLQRQHGETLMSVEGIGVPMNVGGAPGVLAGWLGWGKESWAEAPGE